MLKKQRRIKQSLKKLKENLQEIKTLTFIIFVMVNFKINAKATVCQYLYGLNIF